MEYKIFVVLLAFSVVSAQEPAEQACEDIVCTQEYVPLCGSNGKTYSNKCVFGKAQCLIKTLTVASEGECQFNCEETACTKEYRPICGSDGTTYGNPCMFKLAQCKMATLNQEYEGPCGGDAHACDNLVCTMEFDPHCGSDGRTYSNLCQLQATQCKEPGIHLSYKGACKLSDLISAEEEHHHAVVKPGFCPARNVGELGQCRNECDNDNECNGASKCCDNGCAMVCKPARVSKAGVCPVAPTPSLSPEEACEEPGDGMCDSDVDCLDKQKCCFDGCHSVCVDPQPREGFCPELPTSDPVGTCNNDCTHDHECEFPQKCCASACGYSCVEPEAPKEGLCVAVDEATPLNFGACVNHCHRDSDCVDAEKCCSSPKEGLCAAVDETTPLNFGACVNHCHRDSDCVDAEKCCSNGCGNVCQEPEWGSCEKDFRKYHNGETKLDVNNCDECTCTNGTIECTTRDCFCEFHGKNYASGDIFKAKDGCNRCQCFGLKVICTDFICHEKPDESKRILGIVLGCIFGALFVILVVAVTLVVVSTIKQKKKNKGKPKSSKGGRHHPREAEPLPAKV